MKNLTICLSPFLVCIFLAGSAQAVLLVNEVSAGLDMRATITLSDGAQMTFVQGHGANAAYAYACSDVDGVLEQDEDGENGWNDWMSYSAAASTTYTQSSSSATVNTAGFDYSIEADTMAAGYDVGDYVKGLSYAYAWPDWLRCDVAGTATITIDYTYTVDASLSPADAEAHIFMNAFFADHVRTNYLTAQGDWTLKENGTSVVEYLVSVSAGEISTLTDSVSWDIVIPNTGEPYSWWSMWAYGEAELEASPVPEPGTICLLSVGGMLLRRKRKA
ncbi:MAG: PEP-CTERM sorting domain-containing protein [Sedimentisphaerales bacterium]|nr:PEP-CTERM sorting domain-containing protein [Sedimentisphaerales bacterium]